MKNTMKNLYLFAAYASFFLASFLLSSGLLVHAVPVRLLGVAGGSGWLLDAGMFCLFYKVANE